jgi:hypothetical protein
MNSSTHTPTYTLPPLKKGMTPMNFHSQHSTRRDVSPLKRQGGVRPPSLGKPSAPVSYGPSSALQTYRPTLIALALSFGMSGDTQVGQQKPTQLSNTANTKCF